MKIVWQFSKDVSCLDLIIRLLKTESSSNTDCLKIKKRALGILYAFCQEQKVFAIS